MIRLTIHLPPDPSTDERSTQQSRELVRYPNIPFCTPS